MLVPSHLYSPFCEPSFVKGGGFHSGKIAFNSYAFIQFKFKTGEMSVLFVFKLLASPKFFYYLNLIAHVRYIKILRGS